MPGPRFAATAVNDQTTTEKPMETLIRKRIGEIPILQTVIKRLRLREILLSHIKPHGNETVPAVDTLLVLVWNIACGRQPLCELPVGSELLLRTQKQANDRSCARLQSALPCLSMKYLVILLIHLLSTLAKLMGPGGAKSIVADCHLFSSQKSYQLYQSLVSKALCFVNR